MTIADDFDSCWKEDANGCWIWQRARKGKEAARGGGYGCFRVKGRMVGAHRWSYERTHGPIPEGMQVGHKCHETRCVNPAHLELVTNTENQEIKAAALRAPAKLSPADVISIRSRTAAGELQRVVAEDYGLHQADVSNIVRRKYWKHL